MADETVGTEKEQLERARERNRGLRAAIAEAAERSKELEQQVATLEESLRTKDASLRESLELADRLEFKNKQLTRRIEGLTPPVSSASPSEGMQGGVGSWLGFGVGKQNQKMRDELDVMRQELEIKINETATLNMQLADQKEEFDRIVELMDRKADSLKQALEKSAEEAAIAVRKVKEVADKAASERDNCIESLRTLRLEAETQRAAAMEREQELTSQKEALAAHNAELLEASRLAHDRAEIAEREAESLRSSVKALELQLEELKRKAAAEPKAAPQQQQLSEAVPSESPQTELQKETSAVGRTDARTVPAVLSRVKVTITDDEGRVVGNSLSMPDEYMVREQRLRQHYETIIAHASTKAHEADTTAIELRRECDSLRSELAKAKDDIVGMQATAAKLDGELIDTKDDLVSTRKGFEDQMQALAEHIAAQTEMIGKLDAENAGLRGCQVRCGNPKCGAWNTVEFLVSNGGKLCTGGAHPTLTFQR